MYKKIGLLILALLTAFSLFAEEEPLEWRKNITMLVVPREPQAIQVAQDIARRYPVLLVCYQQASGNTAIHAWNGEAWVTVAPEDYVSGAFFTVRPQHTVIVESEAQPAPDILIPDGTWCTTGNRLISTDRRVMTHLLGRYFDFPYRYWVQFSQRYGYTMLELNPGLKNVFWWHYKGNEVMPAFNARDMEADMDKWLVLDIAQPEPIEPVVIETEPETILPAESPAAEPVDAPEEETVPPVEQPDEQVPVEKPADEMAAVKQALEELSEETNDEVDPFSATEIPAAEVVFPPSE